MKRKVANNTIMYTDFENSDSKFGYAIIATTKGEKVLLYQTAYSLNGDWLILSYCDKLGEYRIYKGIYGSCDDNDLLLKVNINNTKEVITFALHFNPFITIPSEVALELVKNNELSTILPKNVRNLGWEVNWMDTSTVMQRLIIANEQAH